MTGHHHSFIPGSNSCTLCGVTRTELRENRREEMLIKTFERLTKVLERIEKKL